MLGEMVHTGRMPDSNGRTLADSASTWMQVVFGGLGVSIAIVAVVIAYFAWVQPHSPDGGDGANPPDVAKPGPGATTTGVPPPTAPATADVVALGELTPTVGAGNLRRSGADLVMRCATGQSSDRERIVEFDLLGRYTALAAELRVSKARDADTRLQLKILADGPQVADHQLTKVNPTPLSIPLDGKQKLRFQLTCQFPDGEITLASARLTHT
jgi:hypothetical protein